MEQTSSAELNSDSTFRASVLWGCVKRRRWCVLLTASITALLALGALLVLPKQFTSEASLVVVQQQVPERYVTPTATTDIAEALGAATQEVLSRSRLLEIISELDLYPKERGRFSPEVLDAKMRKQISIEPILSNDSTQKQINAFKISFTAGSPQKAQAVATRLTQLFIEQNLEMREHQTAVTTGFLREQLDAAKTKLAQQEARVRDFKLAYLGQLPEQQSGNLAILAGLHSQLQNVMTSEARAQEQRVYLQSLLDGYKSLANRSAFVIVPGGGPNTTDPVAAAKARLISLKEQKASLLALYTPQYPGVTEVNNKIEEAQAELKALRLSSDDETVAQGDGAAKSPNASSDPSNNGEMDSSAAQLKSQLEANRLELENLGRDEAQVKADIDGYQKRLNLTPVREEQLAGLERDYDLLKADYTDLLSKETQSQLAGSLEKRQEGQQFRLIDSPSLPVVPSFPKPLPIGLGGLAGGILLALALAFFIDTKDGFFYSEEDVLRNLKPPVVVAIPVLRTASEERARTWLKVIEWAAGSAVLFIVVAAEVYELYLKRIS